MSTAFIIALKEEVNHVEEINGSTILFCGVGKINATIGAQALIHAGATKLINIGSCGSAHHQVGEIIRIGKVFQDIDGSPICAYGHTPFEEESHSILLDAESVHSCFTTDYFYDHQQASKYSDSYLHMIQHCSVFDMELFAIAKVCRKFNIPLDAYKWVSDDGDFSKWQENCEIASIKLIQQLSANHSDLWKTH